MPDTWKHWVGQVVDGKYPLQSYLGGSDFTAVYQTERQSRNGPQRAAIKLVPATPETSEHRLAGWRLAAGLSHPHLLPLYEMGRTELGGVPLLYLVMEFAEENLGQVLAGRALTAAESRAMLGPVLGLLAYLHGKGLVHGHLKPNNIMANGDRLQVSSDGIRREGEPADAPGRPDAYDPPEAARGVIPGTAAMGAAGDVWSLGVTLAEALTQKLPAPAPGGKGEPELPPGMPEPLAEIARHAVAQHAQSRWTVAEIAARLEGRTGRAGGRPAAAPARRSPQAEARPEKAASKRYLYYALPLLAGVALAAVLAVPKLLRQERAQGPATPPAPAQTAPAPRNGAPATPPAKPVPGEVARQVLPPIPQSASDTITGTILVRVRVEVDATGKVTRAALDIPGPSKYFARKSMEAAPQWRFAPPRANGQPVASVWRIDFGYTIHGPHASAKQAAP